MNYQFKIDSYGSVTFWANKTIMYEINVNNGEKVVRLYPVSRYYVILINGGSNITVNGTQLKFTNITLPIPRWLKLPVEVFMIMGTCCIVLAGTRSNIPFALLTATVLLGFGRLSFLRRGETG